MLVKYLLVTLLIYFFHSVDIFAPNTDFLESFLVVCHLHGLA